MKKVLFILSLVLCLVSCKPTEQVIVHHEYITHVKDSVAMKDSTVYIPVERYVDIVNQLDTLNLETSLAKASAYLDTTNMLLRGEIHNKKGAQFKYITIEKVRDSIVYEKVPEPYPVTEYVKNPVNKKILWWAIFASISCLGLLIWTFRKPLMKLIALI